MTARSITAEPSSRLLTRPLLLLLVTVFGGLVGFYLLLSVVPLFLAGAGAGGIGAGLATGVMMFATVLADPLVPRLVVRIGYRRSIGCGLLLLGAPALALTSSASMMPVLGVCLLRGVGLAIVVVVGSALTAELAPDDRRGAALGVYGVVAGVPAVLALPSGVWLSDHAGFDTVFVLAAGAALAPLVVLPWLPSGSGGPAHADAMLAALRVGGTLRPMAVFTAITFAAGVFATFLPLALPAADRGLAAVALLVQSVAMSLARFGAGWFGDRFGAGRLLVPSTLACLGGATLLVWTSDPGAVLAGATLFGAGFGTAQNVTLSLMMERVSAAEYSRTSGLWNAAYDAGFGVGAVGFGLVVGTAGYPAGFVLTAAVLALALGPALLDRRLAAR
jgi:MFS family permease